MDRKKLDELITENMRTVFGFALTRLGNVHEAEELASDIIYRLLRSNGSSVLEACMTACTERAAAISADLAPEHLRAEAELVGAIAYKFFAVERLADALCETCALGTEQLTGIPALCAVTK